MATIDEIRLKDDGFQEVSNDEFWGGPLHGEVHPHGAFDTYGEDYMIPERVKHDGKDIDVYHMYITLGKRGFRHRLIYHYGESVEKKDWESLANCPTGKKLQEKLKMVIPMANEMDKVAGE